MPIYFRLKDPTDVINAFNVDPLYLKHDQQGMAPDYRVSSLLLSCERSTFPAH